MREDEIVDTLADADAGSIVWRFHSETPREIDGKYCGRGVWKTAIVSGKTRLSLESHGMKFDAKTGEARPSRGFRSRDRIAGHKERGLFDYDSNRGAISEKVRYADIELLKRVADLIGWTP